MSDDNTDTGTTRRADRDKPKRGAAAAAKAKAGADFVRLRLAQLVWVVCVLAALVLAAGALLIALGDDTVNRGSDLVKFVTDVGDRLDLVFFDRKDGVFAFDGQEDAETKHALVNWGMAAVVWLVGGKIVDKLIRP